MVDDIKKILIENAFKGSIEREIRGTVGSVFILRTPPLTIPERFAVKTIYSDQITNITTAKALERIGYELKHWVLYRHHPIILTPFFTTIIQDWPYIAMPYCEMNLREYMASCITVSTNSQKIAFLIQILEALSYARQKGLLAHQDLKPENVLLQDLHKRFRDLEDYPFRYRVRLSDFGIANAYKELNVPWGSRPYLAPEQYEDGEDLSKCDIFACGVILHELLTGRHPMGVVTKDVWPKPAYGQPPKWGHEEIWKKWARKKEKLLPDARKSLGPLGDLIESALSLEPSERPDINEFKLRLLEYLKKHDENAHENLCVLLAYYESICKESETSGDTDERYEQRYLEALLRQRIS